MYFTHVNWTLFSFHLSISVDISKENLLSRDTNK